MTSSDFTKIGSLWNTHKVQSSSWDLVLNYTLLDSTQSDRRTTDTIVLWYSSNNAIDAEYIIDYHLGRQELPNFDGFIIAVNTNFKSHITETTFYDSSSLSKSCQTIQSVKKRNEMSLLTVQYVNGTLMVNHTSTNSAPEFCVLIQDLHIRPRYFFGITASSRVIEKTFNVNSFKFYKRDTVDDKEYRRVPNPDDEVEQEILVVQADLTSIVYGQMIIVTILVVVVLVIGVVLIRKFSNTRESSPQPVPELLRLASLREEENKRNSDNIYERTPSGSYYVHQRTPSGNYHIYEKPQDLLQKKKADDYDHLNFNR